MTLSAVTRSSMSASRCKSEGVRRSRSVPRGGRVIDWLHIAALGAQDRSEIGALHPQPADRPVGDVP
jgi:hypothetical protein